MLWSTIKRARDIVRANEVVFCESIPPYYFHFKVKQRDGQWTDVWYKKTPAGMAWDCNSSTKKKNGDSWGCVMNTKADKTRPYCSHTLACKIKLERLVEAEQEKKK